METNQQNPFYTLQEAAKLFKTLPVFLLDDIEKGRVKLPYNTKETYIIKNGKWQKENEIFFSKKVVDDFILHKTQGESKESPIDRLRTHFGPKEKSDKRKAELPFDFGVFDKFTSPEPPLVVPNLDIGLDKEKREYKPFDYGDFFSAESHPTTRQEQLNKFKDKSPWSFNVDLSKVESINKERYDDLTKRIDKETSLDKFAKLTWGKKNVTFSSVVSSFVLDSMGYKEKPQKDKDSKEDENDENGLNSLLESLGNMSKNRKVPHMFSGGKVSEHPGSPQGSDTVPAWLDPKEYVVNGESTEANFALLEKINKAKGPVHMASGGGVGRKVTGYYRDQFDTAQLIGRSVAGDPTAIAGLVQKAISKLTEKIEKMIDGFSGLAFGSEKGGDIISNIGKTGVLGPFSGMVETIGESIEALRKWNDELKQGNLRFSEFSSSMALVNAEETVRNITLSRERGERRGGTARRQAAASFELEKRMSIVEDAFGNMRNILSYVITEKIVSFIDTFSGLFPSMTKFFRRWANADEGDGDTGVFLGPNQHNELDEMIKRLENNRTLDRPPRFR